MVLKSIIHRLRDDTSISLLSKPHTLQASRSLCLTRGSGCHTPSNTLHSQTPSSPPWGVCWPDNNEDEESCCRQRTFLCQPVARLICVMASKRTLSVTPAATFSSTSFSPLTRACFKRRQCSGEKALHFSPSPSHSQTTSLPPAAAGLLVVSPFSVSRSPEAPGLLGQIQPLIGSPKNMGGACTCTLYRTLAYSS